jgi:hypothetical protein
MDILSLSTLKIDLNGDYNLFSPNLVYYRENLIEYTVEKSEEMRLDLVMLSVYNNDYTTLENMDIVLMLNNIDNPLNISEGDVLYLPQISQFNNYRYSKDEEKDSRDLRNSLAYPSKSSKIDKNRGKFVDNNYLLPPVVLEEPKKHVRVNGDKLIIGGLN